MRICLIATEFPGIGAYGGFGVLTHDLALGLIKRGLEVYVAMPRKEGQKPIEVNDGLKVVSYPSGIYVGLRDIRPFAGMYKTLDADIYHSQEPSIGSALAQLAAPHRKHIITFQDPRDVYDWRIELAHRKRSRLEEYKFWFYYQREVGKAARNASASYCQAKYTIDKVVKMYRLRERPGFLPNPVRMPKMQNPKDLKPTVCYVGRWDERKRPELFFDLAARFPNVRFIAGGACLNNPLRDAALRRRCQEQKNIEMPGWFGDDERGKLLDRSWILINTSTRECLPVSFLEAGAHRCAILSHCNPDEFAGNFGFRAERGDIDDYAQGLTFLLDNERWKALGEKAYHYVRDTHEYDRVIDQHISIYRRMLKS
jgi:glycosyltransferase involved in cell wall biosynthesis